MQSFLLQREQWIPKPIKEVFTFFANARNLEAITPPWLGFQILSPEPILMAPGTLIEYRLRWHWFPMRWVTEIRSWDPPTGFVDVHLAGGSGMVLGHAGGCRPGEQHPGVAVDRRLRG